MTTSRDYLELSFRSIECFADDGRLDADELRKLFAIAKKDGVVDADEKRVLKNIISKIKPDELDEDMLAALEEIKEQIA